jgi:hypothetical protein
MWNCCVVNFVGQETKMISIGHKKDDLNSSILVLVTHETYVMLDSRP